MPPPPIPDDDPKPAAAAPLRQRLQAAIKAHQAGRWGEAIAGYEAVLAAAPDSLAATYNLGDLRLRQGDPATAEPLLARAAGLAPDQAQVWARLAQARQHQGEAAGAYAAAEAGLARDEACHNARYALALAARDLGALATAQTALEALLAAGVAQPAVRLELGRIALARDDPETARTHLDHAWAHRPDSVDVAINLAAAHNRRGDPEAPLAALEALEAVESAGAGLAAWQEQAGFAHQRLGRKGRGEAALHTAVELGSTNPLAFQALGDLLFSRNALAEAAQQLQAGLAVLSAQQGTAPAMARLLNDLAKVRRNQARLAAAREALEEACRIAPELARPHSNYLMLLHYFPEEDAESIYRAHLAWQSRHAGDLEATAAPPSPGPAGKTPLVVGVLGRKFGYGPALALYLPAFEQLDPGAIRLIVYDLGSPRDSRHRRLRRAAGLWRDVAGLAEGDVAARIEADGVDILINKMGHAEGYMTICAMKPAPIQVQWGGFNTSALQGMDWFLGDPVETPASAASHFTERIYRLPDAYVVFDPPSDLAGPVAPLPAQAAGVVTFGCFNHPAKINESVAALWGRVLAAVPGSRLFLKGQAFDDAEATAHIRAVLAHGGIPEERLILEGWSPPGDLLAAYNRVDIALDPWPYSGGLTTLEALWMGVPTVTLPGPTFVGRHAATHLSNTGQGAWIAADADDYVAKAAAWAAAPSDLAALRSRLRDQVAASPVCDGPRFARNLTAALQHMQAVAAQPG